MFMQIAIGAIGIAIVLFVGYIIVAQVKTALPGSSGTVAQINQCASSIGTNIGTTANAAGCYNTTNLTAAAGLVPGGFNTSYLGSNCGATYDLAGYNTSSVVYCSNTGYNTGTASAMTTVYAGFGLVAVGIIVLAAFGLIQVFQ